MKHRALILIAIAINLLLTVYFYGDNPFFSYSLISDLTGDQHTYVNIADKMTQGYGVCKMNVNPNNRNPSAYAMPGFPFMISIFLKIFNFKAGIIIFLFFQKIISYLTGFYLFKLVKKNFNEKIGMISLLIYLVYPQFIMFSIRILTETWIIFLSVGFMYIITAIEFNHEKISKYILLSLVCIGILYIRPEFILLLFIYLPFHIFKNREYKNIFVTFVILAIAWSPWIYRNYKIYDKFIPLTSIANVNRAFAFAPNIKKYLRNSEMTNNAFKLGMLPKGVTWDDIVEEKGEVGSEEYFKGLLNEYLDDYALIDYYDLLIYKLEYGFRLSIRFLSLDYSLKSKIFSIMIPFMIVGAYICFKRKRYVFWIPFLILWLIQISLLWMPIARYRIRVFDLTAIILASVGLCYINKIKLIITNE